MNKLLSNFIRPVMLGACAMGFAAAATPALAIIAVSEWQEVGDAGGIGNPQATAGNGALVTIRGSLGEFIPETESTDNGDVFTIRFCSNCESGFGDFEAFARFDDGELAEFFPLVLELFSEQGESIAVGEFGSLFIEELAAGIYHLGVFTDIGFDPPFTVTFDNLNVNPLNPLNPASVPEPVTLGLLGAGLAGIGAFRRRRA